MDSIRDERRTVTALFADLVGSTALAERLDPEEVRLIVGEAVARMVRAVEAYGGTVKDLAGDGCLALFGAPVTHEDDAERAVRTALRIVRDIEDYGRDVARSWSVDGFAARVGVATGAVVVGTVGAGSRTEYGAFGDAVNVAARLQAAAEPGTVMCAAATHRLVAELFDWSPAQELRLKGKSEPVTAHVVAGPSHRGRVGRASPQQVPLVGRQDEMTRLLDAASGLSAGTGAVVLLSGEPGIGKSRLVSELRDRLVGGPPHLDQPRVRWIEGRCLSYGESLPYWPFRDLLRDWLGVSTDEPELRARIALRRRSEELYGEHALDAYPYLAGLLDLELEPEAGARVAEQSPEARQYRTWEVVGELLSRLATDRPLVVVLEDLHWADPTSLALAERLLGVTEEAAVLLVLTHRAERDHPSWRLRETATREYAHRTLTLDLQALPGAAERALLESLVGRDTLPMAVAGRIIDTAEGNPFFLEEQVRSLTDAGALVREEGGWRFDHDVDFEVPPTVGQVIHARLDRLAPETHEVVRAAAVLGRRFDLPLLEGVSGDGGHVQAAIRELLRLDLLRESRRWPRPEFQFKHVLIQEAAYATLLETQRRELHRRAALWLEERYASDRGEVAGLLAHHWLAAEDAEKAATYLSLAGDRARAEHALDVSIGHYRALLPILERRGERQEMALVLFKLALALHFDLRFREADEAYQQAFRLWQPPSPPALPTATLAVATDAPPFEADPPRSHFLQNIQLQMSLLDRLVEAWPDRAIVPSLAEQWTISADGLRYVFRLREGIHWSDGVPITAADVELGVKRMLDPQQPGASVAIYFVLEEAQGYYLGQHNDLERVGVRALDERQVEFRLNAPAPYFMNVVNRTDAAPQPRHAIERDGDRWVDPAVQVVSGAFRRVEWSTAESAVLERRPESSGPRRGNVARVELRQWNLEQAGDAYRRGELDVIIARAHHDEPRLMAAAAGDLVPAPAAFTTYAAFRPAIPPFDRREVRLALAHAIDRDAVAQVLPSHASVARGGLVPPALHGHTPDIAPRFDPELARDLLRRSGERPEISMLAVSGIYWGPLARVLAETWRAVLDVPVRLLEVSREERRAALSAGRELPEMPIELNGWFPGYPDPEYFLRLLLHSAARDNVGRYANREFDDLIERARRERDVRQRLELFHQADRLAVAEEAAIIPLDYSRNDTFVKPWVSGWWEYGKAWSSFADLVVDERSPRFRPNPPS
ncbi:MAG TPA: ABC transporter substrate-binding protein [Candidatus Limnocylindria bacterium]|nr:ABC transporter substrate-binding protein [Candidatus Limnocylindria bacterium]